MPEIIHHVSTGVGIAGAAIILYGVVFMFLRLLRLELSRIKRGSIARERERLRHQLGSYLLLGLEFMIAADIIGTIYQPSLQGMAVLGSIVVIRTVISFFLDREMAMFHELPDTEE